MQRRLKEMRHKCVISKYKEVVILIDTTYWGRSFGLMVIKDALRNKILWHKYVNNETVSDYLEGIAWLRAQEFKIYGIVCDGLSGLCKALFQYRVQMCQVHQQRIVRTYLTTKPDLDASKELLSISKMLTRVDKESFITMLDEWFIKWKDFLSERSIDNTTGKKRFTHKRLRSAYYSLKRNMPYLWTFYDNPNLGIPNTNNAIEGTFTDIKSKLRVHSGIAKENRKKFLDEYISRHYY